MLKDYAILGVKNLFHRRLRSWLTVIGILIGITAIIALISLGMGMKAAITDQFKSLGTNKILVQAKGIGLGPPGQLTAAKLKEDDLNTVKKSTGVAYAAGRIMKSAKIDYNDRVKYMFIVSNPDDKDEMGMLYRVNRFKAFSGRLLRKNDQKKVNVGSELGDKNRFGRAMKVGDKIKIQDETFEIAGILKKTGNPQFDIAIVMPEKIMKNLMGIDDEYSIIVAEADDSADPEVVAENIEKDLRNERNVDEGKEDFSVQTSREILDSLNRILSIVQIILVGIAMISMVIGGIGIANTMYTAVVERTREIGVMKAIGASRKDIILLFLIEAGLLGLIGGAFGILLGYLISKAVEMITVYKLGIVLVKAVIPWQLVVGALLFSFITGCISGVFPAMQAARLDPAEAIRK